MQLVGSHYFAVNTDAVSIGNVVAVNIDADNVVDSAIRHRHISSTPQLAESTQRVTMSQSPFDAPGEKPALRRTAGIAVSVVL